jgi:chromosome segregation ATPase
MSNLDQIVERAMQPFSLLALAPQMRESITRTCEEAHTAGWDAAMRSCGNQIQDLRAQIELLGNELAHKSTNLADKENYELRREIQQLRQQVTLLKDLVEEVRREHRDDQYAGYNECDKSPCKWCADAIEAMK